MMHNQKLLLDVQELFEFVENTLEKSKNVSQNILTTFRYPSLGTIS